MVKGSEKVSDSLFVGIDRWGPQLEQATYKNRQRLYLSEQARYFLSLAVFESVFHC